MTQAPTCQFMSATGFRDRQVYSGVADWGKTAQQAVGCRGERVPSMGHVLR